jgi:hypothetical protein
MELPQNSVHSTALCELHCSYTKQSADQPPSHLSHNSTFPLQLLNVYVLLFDNPMSKLAGDKRFVLVIGQKGKTGYAVVGV